MMASSACIRAARSFSVLSTTAAGTISHAVRGFASVAANSSREAAPTAPSLTNPFTASRFRS